MSTRTLRRTDPARRGNKAKTQKAAHAVAPPSAKAITARLAKLKAAAMPWLAKDVDLTPEDGGPEAVGPADYPPAGRDPK